LIVNYTYLGPKHSSHRYLQTVCKSYILTSIKYNDVYEKLTQTVRVVA